MIKKLSIVTALLLNCLTVLAQQNARTAYFMDSYVNRYRFNPALELKYGHVGFLIGGISAAPESNLGISTFRYPSGNGQVYSFLSPEIESADFMSNISEKNLAHAGADINLVSVAFKTKRFTHFIDLGIRSNTYANAPYDAFRLLKEGNINGTHFNFDKLSLRTENYAELSYGLSTRVGDRVRLGGRFKLLGGIAQTKADFTRAQISANGEQWTVEARGKLTACLPTGFKINQNEDGSLVFNEIETPDSYAKSFPAGLGASLDFGIAVDITDWLQASFAVLDLGMIRWKNGIKASTSSDVWEYSGFQDLDITEGGQSGDIWSERFNEIKDDFFECFTFYEDSEQKLNTLIEMTLNAGLEYTFPSYDKMSVGLLGSGRINGPCSWAEGRLSLNWAPTDWFSFSASGAYSNFGPSAGVALNLRAGPVDFFAGIDSLIPFTKVNSQCVPVGQMNTNASVGLNILLR